MDSGIAVNFRRRRLKNLRPQTFGEPQHIDCAMHAGLGRLNWVVLVVYWRGRARQIIDLIDLNIERKRYVMSDQFEIFVVEKTFDVALGTGKEIIEAKYVHTTGQQSLA